MLHKLSFHVEPAAAAVPGETEPLSVAVHPLVNGQRLDPSGRYFFDVGLVLALRAHNAAPVDFFTCSCGVAGCIGIYEPSELRATADTVSWLIPTGKHGVELVRLPGAGPLLQFTFDRSEYELVLDDLVRQLERVSSSHGGRGVDIWACSEGDGSLPSLGARIAEERERAVAFYDREAWRRQVFGDLLFSELEFTHPNGYIGCLPLENLAYMLSSADHFHLSETAMAHIESVIVPSFRMGIERVTEMARTLAWTAFVHQAFRSERSPVGHALGHLKSAPEWPAVSFALVSDSRTFAP